MIAQHMRDPVLPQTGEIIRQEIPWIIEIDRVPDPGGKSGTQAFQPGEKSRGREPLPRRNWRKAKNQNVSRAKEFPEHWKNLS